MKFTIIFSLFVTSIMASKYKVIKHIDCYEYFKTDELKMFLKVGQNDFNDGYDLLVSSKDKKEVPFGLVAFAPSHDQIDDTCSAQLIDFKLARRTGELYATDQFNRRKLIAKPKYVLPHFQDLGEVFGVFYEYELLPNIQMEKIDFQIRKGKTVIWSWDGREVDHYHYKNLNLVFKDSNKRKRYSSF